jgi:hypothetical protein
VVTLQIIVSLKRVDGLPWAEGLDAFLARLGLNASVVYGHLDLWDGVSVVLWFTSRPVQRVEELPSGFASRVLPRTIIVMAPESEIFELAKGTDILGAVDSASYCCAAGLGPDLRRATALLGAGPWALLVPTRIATAHGLPHQEHFIDRRYCCVDGDSSLPEAIGSYLRKVQGGA